MAEHAVIAYLPLVDDPFGSEREHQLIYDLSGELEAAIDEQGVGEFDGEEFGGGLCVLFIYGPDADRLFSVVGPILKASAASRGGYVIKRYGDASNAAAVETREML